MLLNASSGSSNVVYKYTVLSPKVKTCFTEKVFSVGSPGIILVSKLSMEDAKISVPFSLANAVNAVQKDSKTANAINNPLNFSF